MPKTLNRNEIVDIMSWHGGYNEEPIDLSNPVDVCNWCREYHKYHLPKDTGDVLYRWNIAVYQLIYIESMLNKNKREPREWCEAIASSFIHAVACFENCGIDCSLHLNFNESIVVKNAHPIYNNILHDIPYITRQVLYRAMHRKKRFDFGQLNVSADLFLDSLISLNYAVNPCLFFDSSLNLAMAKLQNKELNQH